MKNKDKILQQSMYDFLCMMQRNLEQVVRENTDVTICIMDALGDDTAANRCVEHNVKCEECIQSWMDDSPF